MSKKSFKLIAGILLCLSSLVGCTNKNVGDDISDEEVPDITHVHTYETRWTTDSTYHWHNSTCGHDVVSDKGEHVFVVAETPATYQSAGEMKYTCSVCGYSYTTQIDKLVHNYSDTLSFNENAHWYACLDKGYESLYKGYELHDIEITEQVESTYEEYGHIKYSCTHCDYTYVVELDLADHHYDSDYSSDEHGHWYACIDEGYEDSVITGFEEHDYEVTNVSPTYEKMGKTIHTCKKCGFAYTEDVDKLEHHFSGEYSFDGTHHYKQCIDPGYEDLRIEEEEHDFVYTNHEATYERGGYCNETCKICGYSHDGEEGQPLAHYYSTEWSTDGFRHWHQCIDEGYEDLKSDFGLHDFDEEVHEPTFTEYGWTVLTCKDCGVQYIRDGQDYKKHSYSEEWSSSDDGHWHQCTDEGYEEMKTSTEGHVLGNWVVDTIPTSYQQGQMHRECKICHHPVEYVTLPTETYTPDNYLGYSWNSSLNGYYVYLAASNVKTVIVPSSFLGNPVIGVSSYGINSSSVERIVLPNTVTHFDYSAFQYCTNLKSIYIPDGTQSISSYMFNNCSSLEDVYIPDSVTSIGGYAFYNCSNLKTINIPEGVVSIGSYSFICCSSLDDVVIPDSVKTLSNGAFSYCTSLETIKLSENITYLDDSLFDHTNIEEIEIGPNVNAINSYFFSEMNNLSTITVHPNNTNFKIIGDCLYSMNGEELVKVPNAITGEVAIAEGTIFGRYTAFNWCTKVESISIPSSFTGIDMIRSLSSCMSLESIVVEETNTYFKSIDGVAFQYYEDTLSLVNYPRGKTQSSYTIPSNCSRVGNNAFAYNSNLLSITFSNSLNYIGEYAFQWSSLTNVDLSMTCISNIAYAAFNFCGSLQTVLLPNTVTTISGSAFYSCINLSTVSLSNDLQTIGSYSFAYCSSLEEIDLPSCLVSIESCAFYECRSIVEINLPSNLNAIGSNCFSNCKAIETITIPSNITYLSDCAFFGCDKLKTATLLEGVNYIGDACFANCISLESVDLPSTLSQIYPNAFSSCQSLVSIVIPNSVTDIGSYAFYNCSSLSNIKLPNQNTTIRSYTFAYCTSLEYLVIPGTVTCIEDYAFYGIHNPFKVYFEGAGCVVGYTDVPVTTYYYSESESGGCWRYVDGVPTPW